MSTPARTFGADMLDPVLVGNQRQGFAGQHDLANRGQEGGRMKRVPWGAVTGIGLIVIGLLFFLESLGLMEVSGVVVPLVFGFGGLALLYLFLTSRTAWWAIIPGCGLLGLAALIAWERLGPTQAEGLGPAVFMAALAVGFRVVYLRDRESWWAVMPGGVLLTLALVIGLSSALDDGPDVGGVFLLGLAATFLLLSLVPTRRGRMRWALIPAGALFVVGLFVLLPPVGFARYAGPAILILVGLFFVVRMLVPRKSAD